MKTSHRATEGTETNLVFLSSGIGEIERRQYAAALKEWRGFWTGLGIALMFGVTGALVIWAAVF